MDENTLCRYKGNLTVSDRLTPVPVAARFATGLAGGFLLMAAAFPRPLPLASFLHCLEVSDCSCIPFLLLLAFYSSSNIDF